MLPIHSQSSHHLREGGRQEKLGLSSVGRGLWGIIQAQGVSLSSSVATCIIGTAPSLFPFRFRRVTLSAGLRPALAGAGATPKPQKRNAVLEAFPDVSVISNPVRQLMGKPPETTHFSYWQ